MPTPPDVEPIVPAEWKPHQYGAGAIFLGSPFLQSLTIDWTAGYQLRLAGRSIAPLSQDRAAVEDAGERLLLKAMHRQMRALIRLRQSKVHIEHHPDVGPHYSGPLDLWPEYAAQDFHACLELCSLKLGESLTITPDYIPGEGPVFTSTVKRIK